ncbi:hypothetical protein [Candidatus Albibeggiatoa sp. nov. BB20]|uniref:hypothetical protein n=1 Tax=Candidatus Albibeggiatoa sp. nov. BB20 TaxID=3162723 RepID=UPI003365482E
MTSTFESAIATLVTKTTQLTDEVIDKMTAIDQRVTDAQTELDSHWLDKSTQINGEWISKKAEIDAKLNTFDNRIIYVAPTAQNAGTGVDSDNATTLADALSNHIIPSVANTIKLAQGVHVLPAQELNDIFLVNFEPAGVYDANNPAIICTPNTIDSMISTDVTGITSESQTCDAHGQDETTLHFINSTVRFNNVRLRGTRHCLKLEQSTVFTAGDMDLDLWVYSASCTSHSGTAIHAIDSQIYTASELDIHLWHPDYTGCSDVLVEHVAPIYLDNSKHIVKGLLSWSSNISSADYPTQESIGWHTPFEVSHATAFNILNGSHLHIDRLHINNVKQLFWADNGSLQISFMEMGEHSTPLQFLGQARGHDARVALTNRDIEWHDDTEPHIVRIENVGNVPEQACLIAYDGADVYLDGVKLTTTATACSTFMAIEAAEVFLQNSIIYAPDRDNNQGFMQITHNTNGKVTCKNNQLATRLGDNDTGFVALRGGFTQEQNNQLNFSQDYQVDTYGRYQDTHGNTQGMFSFAGDKTFKIPEDYPTLEAAIADVSKLVISPDSTMTIELAAGEYTLSQDLAIQNMENLIIQGAESFEKNIVSIVSVTGSADNWNVTLQLSDTNDIEIGNYLLIHDVIGTGIPEVHLGGWEVIAISGNNITVKHYCPETIFPTNTVSSGTLKVLKTVLLNNKLSLDSCRNIALKNMAFVQQTVNVNFSELGMTNIIFSQHISNIVGSNLTLNLLAGCKGDNRGLTVVRTQVDSANKVFFNSNQAAGLWIIESASLNFNASNLNAIMYSLYNREGIFAEDSVNVRMASQGTKRHYVLHNYGIADLFARTNSFIEAQLYEGTPVCSPAINTEGNIRSFIAG